jgi:hypothetical protein
MIGLSRWQGTALLKTDGIGDQHPRIMGAIFPARHAQSAESSGKQSRVPDQPNAANTQADENPFRQGIQIVGRHPADLDVV